MTPLPLILTHPVISLVQIPKLITKVNRVHVILVWIINIQMQKLSGTYHFCFRVMHLQCFLIPFNGVVTHSDKKNKLCVMKRHSKNTGQVRYPIKHHILHCYPTKKRRKEKWNYLAMNNVVYNKFDLSTYRNWSNDLISCNSVCNTSLGITQPKVIQTLYNLT